jgi:O-antigen ligase
MSRGGPLSSDTDRAAPPSTGEGAGIARPAWRRLYSPAGLVGLMVLLICVPLPLGGGAFPADALAGVLLVVVGITALRDRLRLTRTTAVLLGTTVLAASAVALTGTNAAESVEAWARYLQLFALVPLVVVLSLRERRDGELVANALVLAGLVQGVVSVVQVATGSGATFQGQNSRATGTFGANDVIAASVIIGMAIVVCVGLALSAARRGRVVYIALAVVLLAPLGLTLSRGSWLSTAFALVVVLAFAGWRIFLATAVCGAAVVVVLVGGFGLGSEQVGERITSIGDGDSSTNDRTALWQTAVDIWIDHPVAGVGLREFPRYRDTYAPLDLSSGSTVGQSGGSGAGLGQQELLSPHNQYLLVLSEQGLLGFLPFAALLLVAAVVPARVAWRGPRSDRGLGAVVVGLSFWQLFQFSYGDLGGATSLITSVVIGLGLWFGLEQPAADSGPAVAR